MSNITIDQWMALLRIFLQVLGTMLTTLGWVKAGDWGPLVELIMQAVGPMLMLGAAIWVMFARSKTATVKSASALPEVRKMEISDPGMAEAAKSADPNTVITITPAGAL